jgi:hypothetical protein
MLVNPFKSKTVIKDAIKIEIPPVRGVARK